MSGVLKFRPSEPEDEPFLRALRSQLDAERLCLDIAIPDLTVRKQILEMQYKAHKFHYDNVKSQVETKDNVIELDGKPIGRFIVTGNSEALTLSDITIVSEFRNMGIGQAVIQMTLSECAQSNRPLRLHVDKNNPAYGFYISMGLYVIEETELNYHMEWHPKGPTRGRVHFGPIASG